jgi:hypothetical protein
MAVGLGDTDDDECSHDGLLRWVRSPKGRSGHSKKTQGAGADDVTVRSYDPPNGKEH